MTLSLAQQIAQLDEPVPVGTSISLMVFLLLTSSIADFDPEDIHPGDSEHHATAAAREHYLTVG
jgi:hypothetical protein